MSQQESEPRTQIFEEKAKVRENRPELPESVYAFGDWLRAHPWVKRVKLPRDVFKRYTAELSQSARYFGHSYGPEPFEPYFTWRGQQAAFPPETWADRHRWWP
jgi:hypothetical protein